MAFSALFSVHSHLLLSYSVDHMTRRSHDTKEKNADRYRKFTNSSIIEEIIASISQRSSSAVDEPLYCFCICHNLVIQQSDSDWIERRHRQKVIAQRQRGGRRDFVTDVVVVVVAYCDDLLLLLVVSYYRAVWLTVLR